MRLPEKLKRPQMGVRPPVQKIWPRHRRWVKAHGCCVPDCQCSIVDFAHLRSAANTGKGQKPHDIFGVSLCRLHHEEQHRVGTDTFGRKYGIDLWALAAEFSRTSPDWSMRASLKLVRAKDISSVLDAGADDTAAAPSQR
ncbi:MAG: putative HNHc nuclease [Stellaceae bacterium]